MMILNGTDGPSGRKFFRIAVAGVVAALVMSTTVAVSDNGALAAPPAAEEDLGPDPLGGSGDCFDPNVDSQVARSSKGSTSSNARIPQDGTSGDDCTESSDPAFERVIQIGDSYSAGVGALSNDTPIDVGRHVCEDHQFFNTEVTPGMRLAADLGAEAVFAACSGGSVSESSPLSLAGQVEKLVDAGLAADGGEDTLIVYSIGGNDISANGQDWVETVASCLLPGPDCNPQPSSASWSNLQSRAQTAHETVLAAFPNAAVRVMGYPIPFNRASGADCNFTPLAFDNVSANLTLTSTEADRLDTVAGEMNSRLAGAVNNVAASGADIEFVPPRNENRPGACQPDHTHVNQWILTGSEIAANSFHPTETGYRAMAADLRNNLGVTASTNTSTPTGTCPSGVSTGQRSDPWGAMLGSSVVIRRASATNSHLNGSLFTNDQDSVLVTVDMIGAPIASADVTLMVEQPGGDPTPVTLTRYCFQDSDGSDRGFFVGDVPFVDGAPFTSLVAQLRSGSELVAGAQSSIATVDHIETDNTLETVGVRLNQSALNELAPLAENVIRLEIQEALNAVDEDNFDIWVTDTSNLDFTLTAIDGGVRATMTVDELDVIVRAPFSWDKCNWQLSADTNIVGSVDLAFDADSETTSLVQVGSVNLSLQGLNFTVAEVAAQDVQVCGGGAANLVVNLVEWLTGLHSFSFEAVLSNSEWLAPVNEGIDLLLNEQFEAALEKLYAPYEPDPTDAEYVPKEILGMSLRELVEGFDLLNAVDIASLGGDADGIYATMTLALPGGPVPDDSPDQALSTSLANSTTTGGESFDAAVAIELAALNRALALGYRPANFALGNALTFDIPALPAGSDIDILFDRLELRMTAAPYLTRAAASADCGTLCLELNVPPIRAIGTRNDGSWSQDLLLTFGEPISVSAITQNADGSFDLTYSIDGVTPIDFEADVLTILANLEEHPFSVAVIESQDGVDSAVDFSFPLSASLVASVAYPVIAEEVGKLMPREIEAFEFEGLVGSLNPTPTLLSSDLAGNTDLSFFVDLNYAPAEIEVPLCQGEVVTRAGTPFDDIIDGTEGRDVIHGLGGNDLIEAHGGDDVICGGTGNGIIDGDYGNDQIHGGPSDDFIRAGSGNDSVWGDAGDDFIIGDRGNDWLDGYLGDDHILGQQDDDGIRGGGGNDFLDGGNGVDDVRGDDGNDTIRGGLAADRLYGGAGNDDIDGEAGNDDIWGGDGNDNVVGGPSWISQLNDDDEIWGGAGNDVLRGGDKDDRIYGGDGDDQLFGDRENDRLYGDAGNDFADGGSDQLFGGDYCNAESETNCEN